MDFNKIITENEGVFKNKKCCALFGVQRNYNNDSYQSNLLLDNCVLLYKAIEEGYKAFLTGLETETEIEAALYILKRKKLKEHSDLCLIIVKPFKNYTSPIFKLDERYLDIIDKADMIYSCSKYLIGKPKEAGEHWFVDRDEFIIRNCQGIITLNRYKNFPRFNGFEQMIKEKELFKKYQTVKKPKSSDFKPKKTDDKPKKSDVKKKKDDNERSLIEELYIISAYKCEKSVKEIANDIEKTPEETEKELNDLLFVKGPYNALYCAGNDWSDYELSLLYYGIRRSMSLRALAVMLSREVTEVYEVIVDKYISELLTIQNIVGVYRKGDEFYAELDSGDEELLDYGPERMGQPWLNDEVELLKEQFNSNLEVHEIARLHKRTIRSIVEKCRVESLI